ncbi:MAG: DUF2157 domain-containing protein [Pseudomonadales bacterium]|nr:DUF2157 domain-containing protein [Pseudomonadales bacterium]
MNNEELLAELRTRLNNGEISHAQLQAALKLEQPNSSGLSSATLITRLLFIIGAIFITLGVIYLVSQLWDDLGTFGRITITLGLGVVFSGVGSWFLIQEPERDIGNVFHGIGGFMVPGGALVTLDEMGTSFDTSWPVTLTIGMVFCFYLLLTWYHRKVLLNFFCFANGTALAYLLLDSLVPTADGDLYDYLTMCIGASYIIYAHLFREDWNARLVPLLLFFGPIGFYGAGFAQIFDTILMEMLYPFLAFGGMVLAVSLLRSRLALSISTLAVIAYIIYFTAEYFADSIGWPVALILLGFAIIGIGYISINLNRKYLKATG